MMLRNRPAVYVTMPPPGHPHGSERLIGLIGRGRGGGRLGTPFHVICLDRLDRNLDQQTRACYRESRETQKVKSMNSLPS